MSSSLSSDSEWVQFALTAAAALTVVALPLLQSDAVSRKLLSPTKLQSKRLHSYKYHWEKQTTKSLLKTQDDMGGDDNLVLLVQQGELMEFVDQCLLPESTPKILSIGVDEQLQTTSREVCIWIVLDQLVYQASLKKLGLLLADKFENVVTTTTLLFLTDASGGLGTQLVTDVLHHCQDDLKVVRYG